jgi:hypothetical protein
MYPTDYVVQFHLMMEAEPTSKIWIFKVLDNENVPRICISLKK